MKIIPINNNGINNLAFGSCFRVYSPKAIKNAGNCFGKDKIRTSTNIFREDLDWYALIQYIHSHFADKEKVQVYSLACSDGSEAYSFAMSVLEYIPKKYRSKYLPVNACDIDREIVKSAAKRRINIDNIEFLISEKYGNVKIGKYFCDQKEIVSIKQNITSDIDKAFSYRPVKDLREAVLFKCSDILTELKNIKDNGNSIIFCRNVFPYLSKRYADAVAETAGEKLKNGSLFIIGDYDAYADIDNKLDKNGFFQPSINNRFLHGNNIFQRGSSEEITKRLNSGFLI